MFTLILGIALGFALGHPTSRNLVITGVKRVVSFFHKPDQEQ